MGDSEEITCYLCAALSLLRRGRTFADPGKKMLCSCKEEVLLKSACVYIYTLYIYVYTRTWVNLEAAV